MGVALTDEQTGMFATHATELLRWNRKINLTAITDPVEVAVKHFLDAIAPADMMPENGTLLDVGTGGGFPGIPLKILRPGLTVTLVDAAAKKINFLQQVIRLLGLTGTTARHCRLTPSERPSVFVQAFDMVICRAFAAIDKFVSIAAPLVPYGGRLVTMKGNRYEEELTSLNQLQISAPTGKTMPATDLFSVDIRHYNLYHSQDRRSLVVLTKRHQPE